MTAAGSAFPESSPSELRRRRKRVRTGSGFLLFCGFVALAGGIGLETAPHYSWRVVQAGREVAALGIENGHLIVAGAFVFLLGLFARALARLGDQQADWMDSSSSDLVAEHMALDLADLRSSLRELAHRTATVAEEQKVLLRNQHALLETLAARSPDEQESHQSNNALFRLAASMDQMSARMETRIKHLDDELRKLESSGTRSLAPARSVAPAQLATRDQGAMLGYAEPAPNAAFLAPAIPQPRYEEELTITVDLEDDPTLPMAPSDEFFETVQQLESAVEAAMSKRARDEAAATIDLAQAAPEALDALLPDDD